MRKQAALIFAAVAALIIGIADAQSINTTQPPTSLIRGTATNDGAAAGIVGEFFVSGASSRNVLFNTATVTITIASPAVVTWTGNPFFLSSATGNGCASLIVFTTTGALPTGLTAGTPVYVTCDASFTVNAFHVSTSVANAIAGTAINTSGTQSGTQTGSNSTALTTGTVIDFGGFALTAGDWDVTGSVVFTPGATTSVTSISAGITTGSLLTGTFFSAVRQTFAAQVPNGPMGLTSDTERVSIAATTNLFCGLFSSFTVSTNNGGGICRARRAR